MEKDKKMTEIKKRMEELQRSQNETIEELGKYQKQLIWEITGKLAFQFKATGTSTRFCKWPPSEVPVPEATWEATEDKILRSIPKRSHQFVQEWEDDEHEFAKAQDKIIKDLCETYSIMEGEIRKVEGSIQGARDLCFTNGVVFAAERGSSAIRFTELKGEVLFKPGRLKSRADLLSRLGRFRLSLEGPCPVLQKRLTTHLRSLAAQVEN